MKITRGHNYTLVNEQRRLYVRKYSFIQTTIDVCNKLTTDCVHASSVNIAAMTNVCCTVEKILLLCSRTE